MFYCSYLGQADVCLALTDPHFLGALSSIVPTIISGPFSYCLTHDKWYPAASLITVTMMLLFSSVTAANQTSESID